MTRRKLSRLEMWFQHVRIVDIEKAWEKIKTGGGAGRDGLTPNLFQRELSSESKLINRRLRRLDYKFLPYVEFLKSKGADKAPRIISIPAVRDRIALRLMAQYLRSLRPEKVSTKLPQDVVAEVIRELGTSSKTHFSKLDVQAFYPSIDHSFLRAVLMRLMHKAEVVDVFMNAVKTPTVPRGSKKPTRLEMKGVPQGLAISNGLAELVMEHVDRQLQLLPDTSAFRFVDDILVLASGDASAAVLTSVRDSAQLAGLEIHDASAGDGKYAHGPLQLGFEFLGYRFDWPRVTVRAGSVHKLESRVARSFTAYRYALARNPGDEGWRIICRRRLQWHLDLIVSGFVFEGRRIGWLAYFSQIRDQNLLQHLDRIVTSKAVRFDIEGEFKSFVRTYRIVSSRREDDSGYVPNFDEFSIDEMRTVLSEIFGLNNVSRLSEEEVRTRFVRRIKKLSRELESDVPSYR